MKERSKACFFRSIVHYCYIAADHVAAAAVLVYRCSTSPHDKTQGSVGEEVTHPSRGEGRIMGSMPDGRKIVLFTDGDVHRYNDETFEASGKLAPLDADLSSIEEAFGGHRLQQDKEKKEIQQGYSWREQRQLGAEERCPLYGPRCPWSYRK